MILVELHHLKHLHGPIFSGDLQSSPARKHLSLSCLENKIVNYSLTPYIFVSRASFISLLHFISLQHFSCPISLVSQFNRISLKLSQLLSDLTLITGDLSYPFSVIPPCTSWAKNICNIGHASN